MENKKILEKCLKPNNILCGLAIFCFVLTALFGLLFYSIIKEDLDNPLDMIKASAGDYAKINVEFLTDYFAISDSLGYEQKTYMVYDGYNFYIACLNADAQNSLQDILDYVYSEEEMQEPEPVTIKGTATIIPDDLRDLAIENYNEIAGEEKVTKDNFTEYFGTYYLDTYVSPMQDIGTYVIIDLVPLILGIIFFVNYQIKKNHTQKSLAKYADNFDKIINEATANDAVLFKKAKVILTRNYCLNMASGLEVYDYKNIVWIYPHEMRYNGVVTQKSIYIVTKDSKAHQIGLISSKKANLIQYEEMYNTLTNKLPNVLQGYSTENKEKAKTLYEK